MRTNLFAVQKHTGKIVLVTLPVVGNATITVSILKYKDTVNYQVGPHGDYVQERGG